MDSNLESKSTPPNTAPPRGIPYGYYVFDVRLIGGYVPRFTSIFLGTSLSRLPSRVSARPLAAYANR